MFNFNLPGIVVSKLKLLVTTWHVVPNFTIMYAQNLKQ